MKKIISLVTFSLILSTLSAQTWEVVGNQWYGVGAENLQELEMINDIPHVISKDYPSENLVMTKYENNAWSDPSLSVISEDAGSSYRSVTDANGVIYVAYKDDAYYGDVSVKKWNGITWEFVGQAGFGIDAIAGYAMEIKCLSDNSVVVAYPTNPSIVGGHGFLEIRRFNGTTWEQLGQNVAGTEVGYISMAVLSNDDIYINYRTIDYDSRTVKYDGANWTVLTTPFDSDNIYRSFIAAGANDEILAWRVNINESVYEFFQVINDIWEPITSPNHVTSSDPLEYNWAVEYNEIDNMWYVGFSAHPVDGSFMKKYNGTSWDFVVGTIDYNIGGFRESDLEFNSIGIPYYTSKVAYNLMTWNPTVGINNINGQTDFTIYPNPSSSELSVSFETAEAQFSLFDMNGKELISKEISNQELIDITRFESGMYIVKVNGIAQRLIIE